MKETQSNYNRHKATGYMVHLGGNHNDKKTKAAYERFKEPPYYLKYKGKQ